MAAVFENNSLLLFRVGPVLCCAPSLPVESIIPPPSLTRPPGSDDAKPGIFRHAGHVISSLDLRYKFGVDKAHWKDPGKVIVTEIEAGRTGFWVDEIMDVIDSPASGWGKLPAHLPRGVFSRTLIMDKKIFLYAEFEQLFRIPTSGYLREYIEHLLQEQAAAEIKQASGDNSLKTASSRMKPSVHDDVPMHDQNEKSRQQVTTSTIVRANSTKTKPAAKVTPLRPNQKAPVDLLPAKPLNKPDQQENHKTSEDKIGEVNTTQHRHKSVSLNNNKLEKTAVAQNKLSTTAKTNDTNSRNTTNITQKNPLDSNKSIETDEHFVSSQPRLNPSTATTIQPSSIDKAKSPLIQDSAADENKYTMPTTRTSSQTRPQDVDDEPNTSIIPGLAFLVLVIGLIFGVSWYVLNMTNANRNTVASSPKRVQPTSKPEVTMLEPVTEDSDGSDALPIQSSSNTNDIESTEGESQPGPTESITNQDSAEPITDTTTINKTDDSDTASLLTDSQPTELTSTPTSEPMSELVDPHQDTTDYKADILKDDSGITIILEAPDETEVFKPVDDVAADQNDRTDEPIATSKAKVTTDDSSSNSLSTQTSQLEQQTIVAESSIKPSLPKPTDTEIIHIVVKGDTLWHIAIRYVNNPYKYPELARLSNIKNPDLIYPGDRVRIIKRSKPSQ